MSNLPKEIKLTIHARQRLEERKNSNNYNMKNLMRSSCKWYGKDDLIENSSLYLHCLYVCRKSNQLGYITDGHIEVIYNRGTGVAVTVLEVKDKFLPITQYIKPSILERLEKRKEMKKMRKAKTETGYCPDCGSENVKLTTLGICETCKKRRGNARSRHKEYVPYINLSEEDKKRVDHMKKAQQIRRINAEEAKETKEEIKEPVEEIKEPVEEIKEPVEKLTVSTIPSSNENYYQMKAEMAPVTPHTHIEKPVVIPEMTTVQNMVKNVFDPLSDRKTFIQTLRNCGCEIPEDTLQEVLDVLVATDKLKDVFMTIAESDSQQAILDLEQALNVVERKLQHDWEYNGFQEADDIKFKGFLTWRRVLKGAIFFWKKLYQTNALIEIQRAWNAYTADPNDKVLLAGDRIDSKMKRYQITTDSISTILNTRRPFTRVFYATSKEEAYKMFVKWMSDRQLHEDKSKTTIVELKAEGEDGRKEE